MVRPLNSAEPHVRKNLYEDSHRMRLCLLHRMGHCDVLLRRMVLSQSCPDFRSEDAELLGRELLQW